MSASFLSQYSIMKDREVALYKERKQVYIYLHITLRSFHFILFCSDAKDDKEFEGQDEFLEDREGVIHCRSERNLKAEQIRQRLSVEDPQRIR